MLASVAAGHDTLENLQSNIVSYTDTVYQPNSENASVYKQLYALYRTLHDAFGKTDWSGSLDQVMKELLDIRDQAS